MTTLNIAIAQLNFLVGDIYGNTERMIKETKHIAKKYAVDLVVFPELSLSGYPPEDLLFRPGFYKRCERALEKIKNEITEPGIIVGYPERIGNETYNKVALIQNGKIIADYAKQKLPNYTVFDEIRYFKPGIKPCVFTLKKCKIGVIICEDTWFPEPIQQTVDLGAQLIISINASPYDKNKVRARENMLKERIAETGLPIIYVNTVGGQDELVFDGGSMVLDATGERVQQAPYYEENVSIVTVDVNEQSQVHIKPHKLPERLSPSENNYKTLVLGVRDYIQKNHFPGALLGLSGGIDSALALTIAVDAIGAENVTAVMMPSQFTSDMSIEDALTLAQALDVKYYTIPIQTVFTAFEKTLAPFFKEVPPDTTEENLQARIRGTLLMALSNKFGNIVLTTGNKSEMAVGYATLYGDMAGGFSVLKDVPKTMVYELARYRNAIKQAIPERILTRAPSAELAYNQTDQDLLPPYDVLDTILERYIEKDEEPSKIIEAGFEKSIVDKIVTMINTNEYKRRQAPIGIRLTQRAFGKDRRYPVTSGYIRTGGYN